MPKKTTRKIKNRKPYKHLTGKIESKPEINTAHQNDQTNQVNETKNSNEGVEKKSIFRSIIEILGSISRENKIIVILTLIGLFIGAISTLGTLTTVPEIRRFLGLETSQPTPELVKETIKPNVVPSTVQTYPLDLGEYIKLLMLPDGSKETTWNIATNLDQTPIIWDTDGVNYVGLPEYEKLLESGVPPAKSDDGRYRYANIRVKIKGKTLERLTTNKEELKWHLFLYGNNDGPVYAEIEPDGNGCYGPGQSNDCLFDLVAELNSVNVKSTKLCPRFGLLPGNYTEFYKVEAKGKEPAYLIYSTSTGIAGQMASIEMQWQERYKISYLLSDKIIESEMCKIP